MPGALSGRDPAMRRLKAFARPVDVVVVVLVVGVVGVVVVVVVVLVVVLA